MRPRDLVYAVTFLIVILVIWGIYTNPPYIHERARIVQQHIFGAQKETVVTAGVEQRLLWAQRSALMCYEWCDEQRGTRPEPSAGEWMNDEIRDIFVGLGSSSIKDVKFRDNWVFAGGAGTEQKSPFEKLAANDQNANIYGNWPEMVEIAGCFPKKV
ncbi:unnamed protein product [Coregonus sp. 'balchen']|nr:unnamed protein product [Coregonus sp. 'balchen']